MIFMTSKVTIHSLMIYVITFEYVFKYSMPIVSKTQNVLHKANFAQFISLTFIMSNAFTFL